jgi:excisionase family DNA binding protein
VRKIPAAGESIVRGEPTRVRHLDDLPMLVTPKQAAEFMGPTEAQVRGLIRNRRLAHVLVGKRLMIPRHAIERFIEDNTVHPCHAEIQVPVSVSSISAGASMSSGPRMAAAGSAARALLIAKSLKSRSPSSSTDEPEPPVPASPVPHS